MTRSVRDANIHLRRLAPPGAGDAGAMDVWRNAARAGSVAVVAWIALLAVVHAALRLPADRLLPGPSAGTSPWLPVQLPSAVPPLTARFVDATLGPWFAPDPLADLVVSEQGAPDGRGGRIGVPPAVDPSRTEIVPTVTNDRRDQAFDVHTLPFTGRSTSARASRDPDEPTDCARTGGTVWYRFVAREAQLLAASTFGSTGTTVLGVFEERGDAPAALDCDTDATGNASITFRAAADTVYLFQVTDPLGGAALVFNLDRVGVTTRVSPGGGHNANAVDPFVSADGRHVGFRLGGPAPGDAWHRGLYVRDTVTGEVELASLRHDGTPSSVQAWSPAISGDGRFVAWFSNDESIVADDSNGYEDVFVHDRVTKRTVRASVNSHGQQGWLPHSEGPQAGDQPGWTHQNSVEPSVALSHDGRFVVFTSELAGLVPGDEPGCSTASMQTPDPPDVVPPRSAPVDAPGLRCRDVFVRDMVQGTTVRVSVATDGTPGDGDSSTVDITPDGRFVLFASSSTNLVEGDTNDVRDVFLHDRDTDQDGVLDEPGAIATQRVSLRWDGGQANGNSGGRTHQGHATVSSNGRRVAFVSNASDLVPGDVNGVADAFVRDLDAGTTIIVSAAQFESGTHAPSNGAAHHASLSGDGRYVALSSEVSNGDGTRAALVYDLETRTTVIASVSSAGEPNDGSVIEPTISKDGSTVVFTSIAGNLDGEPAGSCPASTASAQFGRPDRCWVVYAHRLLPR